MKPRPEAHESGFTIHELLVVMVVGSMIVVGVLSTLLFVHKQFIDWREKAYLRDVVETTANKLTGEISKSRLIVELTDTTLILARAGNVNTVFNFGSEYISCNGIRMNPTGTTLLVKVAQAGGQLIQGTYKITVSGSARGNRYEVEALVRLRQSARGAFLHSNWN